jgi:hypothetical protein
VKQLSTKEAKEQGITRGGRNVEASARDRQRKKHNYRDIKRILIFPGRLKLRMDKLYNFVY